MGCGPHIAAAPWVNFDLVRDEAAGILPNALASLERLPIRDGSVERLYAGHCLEHIPLGEKFDAAMMEIKRVIGDDGIACFVCPDVYEAIRWYKDGRAPWELVDACLEGPDDGIDPASAWDGCFHAWNATAARLQAQVARTFTSAESVSMNSPLLNDFPVVSRVEWQCAVVTRV